jgi:hypothetical protein
MTLGNNPELSLAQVAELASACANGSDPLDAWGAEMQ